MSGDIAFESPAGTIGAWRADPVSAPRGAIIVVQEIFGVNAHVRAVADRYAAEGYVALAPAFFDAVERDVELGYDQAGVARGRDLAQAVGLERAAGIAGAAARLLQDEGLKTGIVGFCWGGTVALLGNLRHGLPASSYYGARDLPFLDEPLRAPIQFHFGADDPSIPPDMVEAHRAKQPDAEVYVYDGAGHAFNRDIDPSHYHADAAKLAHQRTMRLFAETLG
jgi:carboxymethylenebutenolidase